METTGTGFLTFVTTASSFTKTRTNAATYATTIFLGALCGFECIKLHIIRLFTC
jgi:hypothetical protein